MTPQAVADLVEHGASDLVKAPFVHPPEKLLDKNAPYFENRAALKTLLEVWLGR